jgi:hypothetical protein
MPPKTKLQPEVGNLVKCRLTTGTFSYTSTRKIVKVLSKGKRFVLDGKGDPVVDRQNILAVHRVIAIS